ncbi:MAG: DUF6282 family protein [Candidatus Limnocylindria bacterium]
MRRPAQEHVVIGMDGAIDLHFHDHPDLFPRLGDDFDVAEAARALGMRAILIKGHHESTVSRAYLVDRVVVGLRVFGGIVLNSYVGGLNPAAVEAALRLGGKAVWMPTIDAGYHAEVHGSTGVYATQSGGLEKTEGIWILDSDGRLLPQVRDILALVAEHNVMLGTSHLSPAEIGALVPTAIEAGVEKVVITHPFYKVPNLDLDTLAALVGLGAIAEFEYCGLSPAWHVSSPEAVVEAVRRIGASRCTIVSDAGQRHNPLPPESLRVFAQTLFEKGLSLKDVETMMKGNPAELLDYDGAKTWEAADATATTAV